MMPGNNLRIANIHDTDVEACCGTHCDNTSEVDWIEIFKTSRISDCIVRLYYVTGKKVLRLLNAEIKIINHLKDMWGINQQETVLTAERIFRDYSKFENDSIKQKEALLKLQLKSLLYSKEDRLVIDSTEKEANLYFSSVPSYLSELSVIRC
jgi:alanyl-tRNA synthetase